MSQTPLNPFSIAYICYNDYRENDIQTQRPEQDAFVLLQRAADRLQQEADILLKSYGITPVQYNVLRILRGASPGGLNCGQIAGRMINREPDMTRLLDRLETRGWVVRKRPAGNRRTVLVYPSESALALLADLDEPVLRMHQRQFQQLGPAATRQLGELLLKVGISEKGSEE